MEPDPENRYQDSDSVGRDLAKIGKPPLPRMILVLGVIGLASFLVFAMIFSSDSPKSTWTPKPRTFAIIPFVGEEKNYNYIPFEFIKYIRARYPYYKVVDDAHIENIINELRLKKEGWISQENSAKIGEMVGAQIFIMFDKSLYKGKDFIYPNAYEVQTRLILGSSRIDPDLIDLINVSPGTDLLVNTQEKNIQFLASKIDQLMTQIAHSLEYNTVVKERVSDHEVLLQHGRLFGAEKGMKVGVFNGKGEVIALLEVTGVHGVFPTAKVLEGNKKIRPSMRVKELKNTRQS